MRKKLAPILGYVIINTHYGAIMSRTSDPRDRRLYVRQGRAHVYPTRVEAWGDDVIAVWHYVIVSVVHRPTRKESPDA
jgi:hypothetical protein